MQASRTRRRRRQRRLNRGTSRRHRSYIPIIACQKSSTSQFSKKSSQWSSVRNYGQYTEDSFRRYQRDTRENCRTYPPRRRQSCVIEKMTLFGTPTSAIVHFLRRVLEAARDVSCWKGNKEMGVRGIMLGIAEVRSSSKRVVLYAGFDGEVDDRWRTKSVVISRIFNQINALQCTDNWRWRTCPRRRPAYDVHLLEAADDYTHDASAPRYPPFKRYKKGAWVCNNGSTCVEPKIYRFLRRRPDGFACIWIENPRVHCRPDETPTIEKYNIVPEERHLFERWCASRGIRGVRDLIPHMAFPCPGCQMNAARIKSFREPHWHKTRDPDCQ